MQWQSAKQQLIFSLINQSAHQTKLNVTAVKIPPPLLLEAFMTSAQKRFYRGEKEDNEISFMIWTIFKKKKIELGDIAIALFKQAMAKRSAPK